MWSDEKEDLSINPISWINLLLNPNTDTDLPQIDLPIEEIENIEIYVDWEVQETPVEWQDIQDADTFEWAQDSNPYDPDFEQEFNDYFS